MARQWHEDNTITACAAAVVDSANTHQSLIDDWQGIAHEEASNSNHMGSSGIGEDHDAHRDPTHGDLREMNDHFPAEHTAPPWENKQELTPQDVEGFPPRSAFPPLMEAERTATNLRSVRGGGSATDLYTLSDAQQDGLMPELRASPANAEDLSATTEPQRRRPLPDEMSIDGSHGGARFYVNQMDDDARRTLESVTGRLHEPAMVSQVEWVDFDPNADGEDVQRITLHFDPQAQRPDLDVTVPPALFDQLWS